LIIDHTGQRYEREVRGIYEAPSRKFLEKFILKTAKNTKMSHP
jgi:hypothetical protein